MFTVHRKITIHNLIDVAAAKLDRRGEKRKINEIDLRLFTFAAT